VHGHAPGGEWLGLTEVLSTLAAEKRRDTQTSLQPVHFIRTSGVSVLNQGLVLQLKMTWHHYRPQSSSTSWLLQNTPRSLYCHSYLTVIIVILVTNIYIHLALLKTWEAILWWSNVPNPSGNPLGLKVIPTNTSGILQVSTLAVLAWLNLDGQNVN
jgi:hypothetical protein